MKSVKIWSYLWSVFSYIRTGYGEIRSVSSPNTGKYGPEITLYLDTFHAVVDDKMTKISKNNGQRKLAKKYL